MTSYYDAEAAAYDETRGGIPRARAAAEAVAMLVPVRGSALDVAGGTGIVSAELARLGYSVLVVDLSVGMLSVAAGRLPGRVLASSAERLAIRSATVDLVTMVWLLHLLPIPLADRVITEAARVLRPGGHLVTTVDKDLAHGRPRRTNADHAERVAAVAGRHGLTFAGQTSFVGRTKWAPAESRAEQMFPLVALRRSGD